MSPEKNSGVFSRTMDRDKAEVTLPSGRKLVVLETTGREERLLSRLEKNKNLDAINEFLASCTENLDGKAGHPAPKDFKKMLTGDRTAILLHVRKLTHGATIDYTHVCQSCASKSEHHIDIDDSLETMKPYPHGDKRDFEVKVGPGVLHYELSTGETEAKIAREDTPDINTKLRSLRLWEQAETGRLPVNIDQLKSKWIAEIRKAVKDAECVLDTMVEVQCPKCSVVARIDMVGNLDFLFPNSL